MYADRVAFAAMSRARGVLHRRPHRLHRAQSLDGKPGGDGANAAFTPDGSGPRSLRGAAGHPEAGSGRARRKSPACSARPRRWSRPVPWCCAYRDEPAVEAALAADQGVVGRSARHDPGAHPRARRGFPDQPLAALSDPELPDLGAFRLLPVRRRLRLPRSAAGRDGAAVRPSRAGARTHPARRRPPVQGGRRPALVASAGRRGHPLADLRRSPVASLRRRALRQDHRRRGHPATRWSPSSTRPCSKDDQHESFQTPAVSLGTRHALRTLPARGRAQPDLRTPMGCP